MLYSPRMPKGWIRFDRNELAGAFGDIGTDLPLIVGMILAAGLDSASALIMFGVMQIFTGLRYGIPMPVQPLKAMAALVIAQKLGGNVLFGGGLAIGVIMLVLTVTGLIEWLARVVPKTVVRGIQFGLGLQLTMLAVKDYVHADGASGYVLAAIAFLITIVLIGNRRFPAALFVIALGVAYAFLYKIDFGTLRQGAGVHLPQLRGLTRQDVLTGLIVLAIPQIPLSLGNSILATRQLAEDYFPERRLTIRTISFTYSLMNLVNPWFGGIPTCHGSGGMAGHYAFGARTGGSVVMYGCLYLALGLFFSSSFAQVIQVFPKPILGVMLAFEGLAMLVLVRDIANAKADLFIAMLVGLMAVGLPYGYAIGLIIGTALVYLWRDRQEAI
ncbi:MAG TPA: putative sulfate/molybdate transporter [Verrucomicrobiae bacterium]|nr:putative sulfate/molybdate transporter [Verrucomicrobiae bacterium]